jgi:hypothetical protein
MSQKKEPQPVTNQSDQNAVQRNHFGTSKPKSLKDPAGKLIQMNKIKAN